MKVHLFNIISFLCLSFVLCLSQNSTGQNVVNNGGKIVVREGANVIIGGNYINKNDGVNDGIVNLDGNIILKRNWVNLANNDVLVSVGTSLVGNVIMNGTLNQYIEGTHSTLFENLKIKNSKKILNVTDCRVHDTLFVDAVLDLNTHRLKILNQKPIGIDYLSNYIYSETNTNEGLGEIDWQIGSQINSYTVPFGSGYSNSSDLAVTINTKTSGFPTNGSIRFATYPTDCQNVPYPPDVFQLDRSFEYVADRFWNIDPIYDTKPDVGIQLHYLSQEVNQSCNNGLHEVSMQAIRYNTLQHTWDDVVPMGTSYPGEQKFMIDYVSSQNFYAPWCLVSEVIDWEIFFPNAFTPNGDGTNEYFSPIGYNLDKLSFTMYIYNRWGGLVYVMDDINKPWNGTTGTSGKLCLQGVYSWIMFLTDGDGMKHKYSGIVTLIQ